MCCVQYGMKMTEFYEKYMVIKLPNGETIKPRPLTDEERKIFDLSEELNIPPYIKTGGRRCAFRYEVHPLIKQRM